jgi:hypothetical protein
MHALLVRRAARLGIDDVCFNCNAPTATWSVSMVGREGRQSYEGTMCFGGLHLSRSFEFNC